MVRERRGRGHRPASAARGAEPALAAAWWGLVLLLRFVGSGFFCGGLGSLGPSLPFIVLQCLCSGKRDVFVYTRTKERKEGFVNEISVKSRMCSLGVKSKSHHHSFIYFHFLKS